MALPIFRQRNNTAANSVSSVNISLTGVAAGNAIIAYCGRSGTTNRTLTVSDGVNSYSDAVAETVITGGGVEVQISYAVNVAGGNTTITLTASGTTSLGLCCHEVQNIRTTNPLNTSDTAETTTLGTNHICADGGLIDTEPNVYVGMIIVFINSTGGGSNPSGYDMDTLGGSIVWRVGYKISADGYTNEDAAQTTVSSRTSVGAILALRGTTDSPLLVATLINNYIIGRSLVRGEMF